MRGFTAKLAALVLALCLLMPCLSLAEPEVTIVIMDENGERTELEGGEPSSVERMDEVFDEAFGDEAEDAAEAPAAASGAKDEFIEGIISLAQREYEKTKGRAQRAQYSGDIYVCKNFTVYLFRQNAEKFRMAEFPDTPLVIPDNLPKKQCKEYVYGAEWKDIPASDGNPFEIAAKFRYDPDLSKEENRELAREFLKQVKKGDYFQMAAKYYYGTGAHSMIFIADYDPATDTVHWCDSNMKGESRNGERYGYVQFDAVKEIDWFVDAFCRKKYGATLYRLRDDIIPAP